MISEGLLVSIPWGGSKRGMARPGFGWSHSCCSYTGEFTGWVGVGFGLAGEGTGRGWAGLTHVIATLGCLQLAEFLPSLDLHFESKNSLWNVF